MALVLVIHLTWAFALGVLGNLISFLVFLAPLPTFYRVYKKKSTEGFQSVPYVVSLFCAMLWLYYGLIKIDNGSLIVTINTVGLVIEGTYLTMYLIYAPKQAKVFTIKLILLLNVGAFGALFLSTFFLTKGHRRVTVVGILFSCLTVAVFAAPLSVMRLVIKTKSVEFMPFFLSFFLTLSAVVWFAYGLLIKDIFVALPNVLGFMFGMAQMILYIMYKDSKVDLGEKLPEQMKEVTLSPMDGPEEHPGENKTEGPERQVEPEKTEGPLSNV